MHSFDLAGTGHPACRRCPTGQVPAAALPGTAAARSRFRKRPHPLTTVALTHAWRAQLASTVSRITMSGLIALVWETLDATPLTAGRFTGISWGQPFQTFAQRCKSKCTNVYFWAARTDAKNKRRVLMHFHGA